ncbi:hypothetical protein G6O69_25565 [Pseudenhygromyxa sp. WMMC2535]|uniref:hypothetical protein n=1 Tax=Pseudenhygromyxa sp. WMMC2535 TaxID=2712867 RepID=UPI0015961C2F|nr:hypothetical protein [Pseudenhygromyxa sp. WMMC2535]NVB41233.1 hypothetical protein [Pseudenhygromyxa sp. WMMC2535]
MLRGPFPGHRRYSITHRAVQRLRELVPTMDDLDDETLRDRLDEALGKAEDTGKAVRTLDAMLNEPQVLIPVEDFGDTLFAIIKEDTVVTVLPKGHGEEILHRGQALQQRVANGELPAPQERDPMVERWEARRRRWREPGGAGGPVVIERPRLVRDEPEPTPTPVVTAPSVTVSSSSSSSSSRPAAAVALPVHGSSGIDHTPSPDRPDDAVGAALWDALERGSRRAAVVALHELLERKGHDEDLLPVWNEIATLGIPVGLKVSDLIEACALSKDG